MPYLSIQTNKKLTSGDFSQKLEKTSAFLAKLLNKSEDYVMVSIKPGAPLFYGGSKKSAAFVKLKSIGLDKDQCSNYSKALCDFIGKEFEIPCNRIYIEFKKLEREMFGWNGSTF